MIELAVVLTIKRMGEYRNPSAINALAINSINIRPDDVTQSNLDLKNNRKSNSKNTHNTVTDLIDFAALIIFFLSYIIFNCVYMTC